uniref:EGF-like domain-containing protein n=1 Tax=Amphimedon queenslandica TaxID=400682 RepID=A0A1X7T5F0_AMPQE
MSYFEGFSRKALVVIPPHHELRKRRVDRIREGCCMEVPQNVIDAFKANFHIPREDDGVFDEINFSEIYGPASDKIVLLLKNASAAYGTEFYVGAMRNYRGNTDELLLYVTTPSVSSVSFSIKTNNGIIGSYSVNSSVPVDISLSTSLVTNDGLYSSRFKGVYIYSTNGGLISVLVVNVQQYTFGDYMAYPYQNLALSEYQYYAVSTGTLATSDNSLSEVLLVGNEDNTTVTVIPTQTVSVPIDIQTNSNNKTVTAGSSFTFTIHRMQTFLIGAPLLDISGTSIGSNKPLTVISGHECGNIPLVCCCQQIAEQILPTIVWGNKFLLTPYATRSVGPYFKVVAALGSTSLNLTCSASGGNNFNLQNAGDVTTLYSSSSYCSIISNKPVLVTQLGPSQNSGSGNGDPVISLIPPIELHQQNITLVIPGFSTITNNYINIATTTKGPLYINGQLRSVTWNNIYNSMSSIIGYGTQIPFNTISTSSSYTFSMQTSFTALVYGFDNYHGYSYSAGINLTGNDPCLSNNGGCDQLCNSTFGSYACSCYPGFSLDLNGYNCSDIDECADSACEHICVNTIGSYSCFCHDGYSLDTNNRNCSDIDECTDYNECEHICVNTFGNYSCLCDNGYTLDENNRNCSGLL